MSNRNNMLEAIGVGTPRIQSSIMNANEQLNVLLGDKDSGTRYGISFENVSANKSVKMVLGYIADKVTDWNTNIRAYDKPDTRLRCVYIAASIIGPLAKVLYKLAQKTNDKVAINAFDRLVKFNYEIHGANPFAEAATEAYISIISAVELGTASRYQISVEEDTSASAEFHKLLDAIRIKLDGIVVVVREMLDAAGISYSEDSEQVNTAAQWILVYDILRNDIFGANRANTKYYDPNASLDKQIYNLVKYGMSNSSAAVLDRKDEGNQPVETVNVVKDMDNLGANTSQMNILTTNTKFTCRCYYKVLPMDALGAFSFTDNIGYFVYKITAYLFSSINMNFGKIDSKEKAANFSAYVNDIFKSAATKSSDVSIAIRRALIDSLDELESGIPEEDEKYAKFIVNNGFAHSVDEKTRKYFAEAIAKIKTDILYIGSYSVNGSMLSGESIAASNLTSPVYTFGDDNPTDRNTTTDLTTAGKMTSTLFRYEHGDLQVAYDGELSDNQLIIDTIPGNKIKNVYDTYVSSILVPAHVSKTDAWILLCGIKAYSSMNNGDLDDSKITSALTRDTERQIADSNVYQNTRITSDARATRMLSDPNLVNRLSKYDFINPEDVDNIGTRIELIDRVKYSATSEIASYTTKIRRVCDEYTMAVKNYAKTVAKTDLDETVKPIVNSVYRVSPTLSALINGKDAAIRKTIAAYMSSFNSDAIQQAMCVEALSNLCIVLNTLNELNSGNSESINSFVVLKGMVKYIQQIDNALSEITSDAVKEQIKNGLPDNYNEIHSKVVSIYTEVNESQKMVTAAKARSADILACLNALLTSGMANVDNWKKLADRIVFDMEAAANDPRIVELRKSLEGVSNYITSNNITSAMLNKVKLAIASSMNGVVKENLQKLDSLKISQFVIPLKVYRELITIAGVNKENIDEINAESKSLADDEMFALDDGGQAGMGEVTPYEPSNMGNARLELTRRNDDNNVDGASIYGSVPTGGDYIEKIVAAVRSYEKSGQVYDDMSDEVGDIMEYAANVLPNVQVPDGLGKYERILFWIEQLEKNTSSVSKQAVSYAKKCAKQMQRSEEVQNKDGQLLDNYKESYPSFSGLIDALVNGKISSTDVDYMVKIIDAATAQRDNLMKYKSYVSAYNNRTNDAREFAYTESDESTIAQLICILGTYVCAPHNDSVNDLLDSLSNVSNVVKKYSGNPLSVKVAESIIKEISSVNKDDGEELASVLVKLINRLGKVILSRNSDELDSKVLTDTKELVRPATDNQMSGKAIDSFARSQMRSIPSELANKKQIKNLGGRDETAARQAYVDLVANDMKDNPELAKYAYILGNAFNSFSRTMKDARVTNLEERSMLGVLDSLKGVELFKGYGANDLQREIVSAEIDDERNGDSSYTNVTNVVNAAMSGSPINTYTQMYSTTVGSERNIVNDTKTLQIAFDANGNRTTPDKAVALDRETIMKLATDSDVDVPYEDVTDLVHSVRMWVFSKLCGNYGHVDANGDITYEKNYEGNTTKLMDTAIKALYRLCDEMTTPISDIILISTSFGQKSGRLYVMKHAYNQLVNDEDLDLDIAGMVSSEPNAYPQMMTDEASTIDEEWINGITELLGMIPNSIGKSELLNAVEMYNTNSLSQQKLARNDDLLKVVRIIDGLLKVDTATGIPTGFWGDTSTKRKDTIQTIFNQLCSYKTSDDVPWYDCATKIREKFMDKISRGGNQLSIGNTYTSDEAKRRIAHMRMNPYYAVSGDITSQEYSSMMTSLMTKNIIKDNGRIVKLKYPGMSFDHKTFSYIVRVALSMKDNLPISNPVDLFLTALMCVVSGIRVNKYKDLVGKAKQSIDNSNIDVDEICAKFDQIAELTVQHFDEMVKTRLGWFTDTAYMAICISSMDGNDHLKQFADTVSEISSSSGKTTYNLDEITRTPATIKQAEQNEEPVQQTEDTVEPKSKVKPGASPTRKPRVGKKTRTPTPSVKEALPSNYSSNTYSYTDDDGEPFEVEVVSNANPNNRSTVSDDIVDNNVSAVDDDVMSELDDLFSIDSKRKSRKPRGKEKQSARFVSDDDDDVLFGEDD